MTSAPERPERIEVQREDGVLIIARRAPRNAALLLMGSALFMLAPVGYVLAAHDLDIGGWGVGHIVLWVLVFILGAYGLVRKTYIRVDGRTITNTDRQLNLKRVPPVPVGDTSGAVVERHIVKHGSRAAEHWRVDARMKTGDARLIARCFDEAEARYLAHLIDEWVQRSQRG